MVWFSLNLTRFIYQSTCNGSRTAFTTYLTLHSINHSEITLVFMETRNMAALLRLAPKLPVVVSIDPLGESNEDNVRDELGIWHSFVL
jgi:hypothetical protein